MPPNEPIRILVDGKERVFDIDDPKLPDWVEDRSMSAGGYPYDKKMDKKEYEETLENLQVELVKLQYWLQSTGKRVMILFEGRDAAGKGGTIFVVRQYMNPRSARNVALTKPSAGNGTSSATWPSSRRPASSSPSTAPGTTAPGWSR
jgi:polyphosphate kinase 2 (PPK2 family)